jgi:bifunctional non-homologous end joining protein LigD
MARKLSTYREKRDFTRTREPRGGASRAAAGRSFVVQKHAARRLHYDFRLELDGVLLSWAVPKGPSADPSVKRLAVQTEDHPVEYGTFEGTIPKGEYGGGTVLLWDRGTWEADGDAREQYRKGRLSFTLRGERMKGKWHLVRTRAGKTGERSWLLFKSKDDQADEDSEDALVQRHRRSVQSGRTLNEIGDHAPPRRAARRSGGTRAPKQVELELATLVEEAPSGAEYLHEVKFDGYRALARVAGSEVTLTTRNGKELGPRAPGIVQALADSEIADALIDGEVVALRDDGVSDFQKLQNTLGTETNDLFYYVFDLLYADGQDLRERPLEERKEQLRELLSSGGLEVKGQVRYSEHVVDRGPEFFEQACKRGLEGILSKRRDAPYRGGRSRAWLKIKCKNRQEFAIAGYTAPGGSRSHFGAILVGVWEGDSLRYAGKVGTGFSERSLEELSRKLAPLARESAAFSDPPRGAEARGVTWVEPKLVAEVEFSEFTSDGRLRHPRFKGLREDKPAREAKRERPAPSPARANGNAVELSNADKVLYPEQGITKQELADHYLAVAVRMLPHVSGRPLMLLRCPEGRKKTCFFYKHPGEGLPRAIGRVRVEEKDGPAEYIRIDDVEGLVGLVQLGALEIHTWGSHADNYDKSDLLVLDLDPDPDVEWPRVVAAAELLHGLFDQLELESFVKTTGGKGLHVCVPLEARNTREEVKAFARSVADALVHFAPEDYVATMSKAKRRGKIFVDYLRNSPGATFIAPYSTRARPGAPVATPIAWKELPHVDPAAFTLRTFSERLSVKDPWRDLPGVRQRLSRARTSSVLAATEASAKKGSRK